MRLACRPQFDCKDGLSRQSSVCQPRARLNQAGEANSVVCDQRDDGEGLDGVCKEMSWHGAGEACDPNLGMLRLAGFDRNGLDGPGTCQARTRDPQKLSAACR